MKEVTDSNGIKHTSYKDYLSSTHWITKKQEFKKKYIKVCVICGVNKNIDLHHMTYENIGNERVEDLCFLCRECHNKVHNGIESVPSKELRRTFSRSHKGSIKPKKYIKIVSKADLKNKKRILKKEEKEKLKLKRSEARKQIKELQIKKKNEKIKSEKIRNTNFEKLSSILEVEFTNKQLELCHGKFRLFGTGKYKIKCIDKENKIIKIKNNNTKLILTYKIKENFNYWRNE